LNSDVGILKFKNSGMATPFPTKGRRISLEGQQSLILSGKPFLLLFLSGKNITNKIKISLAEVIIAFH
jgi:hypothetical protein